MFLRGSQGQAFWAFLIVGLWGVGFRVYGLGFRVWGV